MEAWNHFHSYERTQVIQRVLIANLDKVGMLERNDSPQLALRSQITRGINNAIAGVERRRRGGDVIYRSEATDPLDPLLFGGHNKANLVFLSIRLGNESTIKSRDPTRLFVPRIREVECLQKILSPGKKTTPQTGD